MPGGGLQEVVGTIVWHFGYNMQIDGKEHEEMIFAAEKAINANSEVRAHIFDVSDDDLSPQIRGEL